MRAQIPAGEAFGNASLVQSASVTPLFHENSETKRYAKYISIWHISIHYNGDTSPISLASYIEY